MSEDEYGRLYNIMHLQVGRVISSFAQLELSLVHVFVQHGGLRYDQARSLIEDANFADSLKRIHSILRVQFKHRPELEFWNSFKPELARLGVWRNDVAHLAVAIRAARPNDPRTSDGNTLTLQEVRPWIDYREKRRLLFIEDVYQINQAIQIAQRELHDFILHLEGRAPCDRFTKPKPPLGKPPFERLKEGNKL